MATNRLGQSKGIKRDAPGKPNAGVKVPGVTHGTKISGGKGKGGTKSGKTLNLGNGTKSGIMRNPS